MKKQLFVLVVIVLFVTTAICQKKELYFDKNGEFKILQFTDLHIEMKKSDPDSETVYNGIKEIVMLEKPDLVVLTGDIITQDPAGYVLLKLADIFAGNKVLWAAVFGNHDEECSHIERQKLADLYRSMPYNINLSSKGIMGETNFIIPVTGVNKKHKALLYFFDSNAYNPMKGKVDSYYAWLDFSQIEWYRKQSAAFTKKNNNTPLPALAFFHIPFPEYLDLWIKDSIHCIGSKQELVASPKINSGMYTAMLECGDVMGTFVGHDHNNDYIGVLNGIALAFGRCSRAKYTDSYGIFPQGGRVIVLKEGKREFETWIRESGGRILYPCKYPGSFTPSVVK